MIICNTSPLINLAETDCLDLLDGLPGTVVAPPAVLSELRAKAAIFPSAARLAEPDTRIITHAPTDTLLVRSFAANLHPGEAECLALAMEQPDSLLIIDDLSARAAARANHLPFTGTLGILAKAKADGKLDALAPVIHALKSQARFWIHPKLAAAMLRDAGE